MKKIVNFFGLMGLGIVLFHIFASGAFSRNKAGNVEMDSQLLMQGVSNGLEPYAQSVEKFNRRKGKP
jgi:hypothetical protein